MRTAFMLGMVMMIPFDGCKNDGVICTAVFVYGVNAVLTDVTDGTPIEGATLTLVDGDYMETMEDLGMGSYAGAGERAGTYTLLAQADGFGDVMMEDIMVNADVCHVTPVSVPIAMFPSRIP